MISFAPARANLGYLTTAQAGCPSGSVFAGQILLLGAAEVGLAPTMSTQPGSWADLRLQGLVAEVEGLIAEGNRDGFGAKLAW